MSNLKWFSAEAQGFVSDVKNWPEAATGVCQDQDGELKFFKGDQKPDMLNDRMWRRANENIVGGRSTIDRKGMVGNAAEALVWKSQLFLNIVSTAPHSNAIHCFGPEAVKFLKDEANWPDGAVGACQSDGGLVRFHGEGPKPSYHRDVEGYGWVRAAATYGIGIACHDRFMDQRVDCKKSNVPLPEKAYIRRDELFKQEKDGMNNMHGFSEEARTYLKDIKHWPERAFYACQDKDGEINFASIGCNGLIYAYVSWKIELGGSSNQWLKCHVMKDPALDPGKALVRRPDIIRTLLDDFNEEARKLLKNQEQWPGGATAACQDGNGRLKFYTVPSNGALAKFKMSPRKTGRGYWLRPPNTYRGSYLANLGGKKNPNCESAHVLWGQLFGCGGDVEETVKKDLIVNPCKRCGNGNTRAKVSIHMDDHVGRISCRGCKTTHSIPKHLGGDEIANLTNSWNRDNPEDNISGKFKVVNVKFLMDKYNWPKDIVGIGQGSSGSLMFYLETPSAPKIYATREEFLKFAVDRGLVETVDRIQGREGKKAVHNRVDTGDLPTLNLKGVWYPIYNHISGDPEFNGVSGLRERGVLPKVLFEIARRSCNGQYSRLALTEMYNRGVRLRVIQVNRQRYEWRES